MFHIGSVTQNNYVETPREGSDHLRHEFSELPLVFDLRLNRYPIAVRSIKYSDPGVVFMTSSMYKTILNLGNDHPYFKLCLGIYNINLFYIYIYYFIFIIYIY